MAIVKQMTLEDAVSFNYLQNFLVDRDSIKHLQKVLFIDEERIQNTL